MTQPAPIDVFLELGEKKVFTGAIAWPGWCRSAKDRESALQTLVDYGPRYARLLADTSLDFQPPSSPDALNVVEEVEGSAATDFGVADTEITDDASPFGQAERERSSVILEAIWRGFDQAVASAKGRELRKGPRGGGRDLDKIVQHILDVDAAYLRAFGQKFKPDPAAPPEQELARRREATLAALLAGERGEIPARGPRGGKIWSPRYFVRRLAWHTADHLWEIEDRIR